MFDIKATEFFLLIGAGIVIVGPIAGLVVLVLTDPFAGVLIGAVYAVMWCCAMYGKTHPREVDSDE